MKRLIAVLLCVVLTLSFVACDPSGNGEGNGNGGNENGGNENGAEITASQWEDAFEELALGTNMTVSAVNEMQYSGGTVDRMELLQKIADGKTYQLATFTSAGQTGTAEYYYLAEGETLWYYEKDSDGVWKREPGYYQMKLGVSEMAAAFQTAHSQFTYDSELGAYVGENVSIGDTENGSLASVTVTFRDGKVYELSYSMSIPSVGTQTASFVFTDVGTTDFALPEIGSDSEGENGESEG